MKTTFRLIRLAFLWGCLATAPLYGQDLEQIGSAQSSVHGQLQVGNDFYGAQGIDPRRAAYTGVISGQIIFTIKGISLPFSFVYGNRNKSFRQPFNRLGLSPRYKWITLHAGYRNIRFSKYVMGGHTMLGVGVELNPGKFRFGFLYGRLKRATNRAVHVFSPVNDTLMDFDRQMMSLKIGFGSAKTFLDLNVLRACDDSLHVDTAFKKQGVFPAANLVTGLHGRWQMGKHLYLETEGAVSLFTHNTQSLIPVKDVPASLDGLLPVNGSSTLKTAVETSLQYKSKKGWRIGLHYRRIDPDYRSMGTYFMQNDLEDLRLQTSFGLGQKRWQISASLGLSHNNLQPLRKATTYKTIGSLQLNYRAPKLWGFQFRYANYSVNQQAGRIQIADSVKMYQTNGSLMWAPYMQWSSARRNRHHFLHLTLMQMQLIDHRTQDRAAQAFTTYTAMLSYRLSWSKTGWSTGLALHHTQVSTIAGLTRNQGITWSLDKRFVKQKISVGGRLTFMQQQTPAGPLQTFAPVLRARIPLGKHHSLQLRANLIALDGPDRTGTEETGRIAYVFQF